MRFIIFSILICVFSSCDRKEKWDLPPNGALGISFSDTSKLLDRIIGYENMFRTEYVVKFDSLAYYIDSNGREVYDQYSMIAFTFDDLPEYPYYYLNLGGTNIRHAHLSIGGKTWFIKWPNGSIDTLFANYRYDPDGPNECTCSEPLVKLTLNSKSFIEKINIIQNGVYIFE